MQSALICVKPSFIAARISWKAEPAMRLFRLTTAVLLLAAVSSPAVAEYPNKDMIQLQTQVQQLLDAVARLQQSNDERMGVLKDLVQQNSDSVNRMSVTIDTLQKQLAAQSTAEGSKTDTVSGQIQALNDSLDEIKARMVRLEKTLNDVSSQQQSIIPIIQNLPQAGGQPGGQPGGQMGTPPVSQPGTMTPPAQPTSAPPPQASLPTTPTTMADASAIPASVPPTRRSAAGAGAPPVDDMYKSAFNDFMAARYSVSAAEFGDVIRDYPDSTLAGNAYYYLGEIDYRGAHYSTAVKEYDKLIEQYPDNNKVPAAHLHKGQALIEMQLKDAGIRELRALIQRFPSSPEAASARSKLNALGVPIRPKA
jgi:tol-pal system protein YbgF